MKRYILGIDIGTSKIGTVLLDCATRQVQRACSKPNDATLSGLPENLHEQSPLRIRQIVAQAVRELIRTEMQSGDRLEGIGITGQMHGVLLTDRQLSPLTSLITWRDQRAAGHFLEHLRNAVGEKTSSRTGCQLHCGYGAVTLSWLFQNDLRFSQPAEAGDQPASALTASTTLALTIADYLAAVLCGVCATGATHAASWGVYDLAQKDWDQAALTQLGIPRSCLPELRDGRPLLGGCTPAAAEEFGVPAGTPVWLSMGDNQASVFAATEGAPGCTVINLGTGGQISFPVATITCNEGCETRPLADGSLMGVGASLCGGWSYAYLCLFLQQVCREVGGVNLTSEEVYARMQDCAPPGTVSSLQVNTRFAGSRGSADGGGSIAGIDTTNFTPAQLIAGFQEGMVRELASLADLSTASSGPSPQPTTLPALVATGNAVRRNPALLAIIERVFGRPCTLSRHQEEAGAGVALWVLAQGAEK